MPPAAAFCALCLVVGLAHAGFSTPPHRLADREFLLKQIKVVDLLLHVDQPDNVTAAFRLEESADSFQEPALALRLAAMDSRGFLKGRGQAFSIHRRDDIEQAKAVVELLLTAKDFHTFCSAATWARQRLSEALFSYAFTVAVLHRSDVTDVVLPAPYELWPQQFVNADVMRRAYDAHLSGAAGDGGRPQVLVANSDRRPASCPEGLVSYFREDVGLRAHWLMKHLRCPFWLPAEASSCDRRGQLFYFVLRQLAARYDLERLSVGLQPVQALRYPSVYQETYHSEERFPSESRCTPQDQVFLPDTAHVEKLKILEERIYDAIDAGYVVDRSNTEHPLRSPEAIEVLGNIIEGNADSINENFYGSLYRGLLTSFNHNEDGFPAKQVPTLMENPATALRDPLFYRAVKKLLDVFNRFQDRLGPYRKDELEFPGVRVDEVSASRLWTHLERFQVELDGALNSSGPRLVALQRRLAARPFHYQLAVDSQHGAAVDALLRVFLGPRRRPGNLDTDRHRFVLFDAFRASLSPGVTTLRRSYKDLRFHGRPPLALSALRRRATSALSSGWRLYVDDLARPLGGVERLALPRGRRAPHGLPLSLLVVVSPAPDNNATTSTTNNNSTTTAVSFPPRDGRPAAFPLDRPIDHESVFDLPNIHFADVNIVHRG